MSSANTHTVFNSSPILLQRYSKIRIVSAGVKYKCLVPPLYARGFAAGATNLFTEYGTTSYTSIGQLMSDPTVSVYPINQDMILLYSPYDTSSLEF